MLDGMPQRAGERAARSAENAAIMFACAQIATAIAHMLR